MTNDGNNNLPGHCEFAEVDINTYLTATLIEVMYNNNRYDNVNDNENE